MAKPKFEIGDILTTGLDHVSVEITNVHDDTYNYRIIKHSFTPTSVGAHFVRKHTWVEQHFSSISRFNYNILWNTING